MARRLIPTLALAVPLTMPNASSAGTLSGPVLDEGITATVEDVLQFPTSSGAPPLARVNQLREAPDGSGRLFANDLNGPFRVIDGGTVHLYADLASVFSPEFRLSPGLATGFVSFAFHPEFASNGLFYTVHTESVGSTSPNFEPAVPTAIEQHSILTEWDAMEPAANSFAGTRRELIRIASPHRFHNLGEIAFNPNAGQSDPDYGLLYIGAGDFGSVAIGQPNQLQRLDTLYGCLLRIDPLEGPFMRDGSSFDYGIPASNPYANDGDPDTYGEIYAHGFRNAHRIHWDAGGNGTAFVSDIGQGNGEEINLLTAGANYGWPQREGTHAIDPFVDPEAVLPLPGNDPSFGYSYPVAWYDHDEGDAIAGGVVYRGPVSSELRGRFVFGDIKSGRMFYSDVAEMEAADDGDPATTAALYELDLLSGGQPATLLQIVDDALANPGTPRTDLRYAALESGEIYITTKRDGYLRRLVPRTPKLPALSPGGLALLLLLMGAAGLERLRRGP